MIILRFTVKFAALLNGNRLQLNAPALRNHTLPQDHSVSDYRTEEVLHSQKDISLPGL